jgi:activating signal cointegrator 1
MRAISLWQPWASAWAIGSKRNETRHWSTNVRGTVAIHAAKRRRMDELIWLNSHWGWCGALRSLGASMGAGFYFHKDLPFGAIVGLVDLVDCRPTDSFTNGELDEVRYPEDDKGKLYGWTERYLGDYSLGRFGWIGENHRLLKEPIPFKGAQGFFNVPDELFVGHDIEFKLAA